MTDTYQDWAARVMGGRDAKPLSPNEVVKSSAGEPFGTVEFLKIKKRSFHAEVGKKGEKYIFHFFPHRRDHRKYDEWMEDVHAFYEKMAQALLEVFKREDQIEAAWTEEMNAYAVRVSGWTHHVWGDELALRAIDRVDELVGGA